MENDFETQRFVGINTNAIQGPLVMFAGPKGIGKTVALVRLGVYLIKQGFQMKVNRALKPGEASYLKQASRFEGYLNNPHQIPIPNNAESREFLLVDAIHKGQLVCQFLEAPGEDFFSISEPQSHGFQPYIQNILSQNFKKIFLFFYEHDLFNTQANAQILLNNYASRLGTMVRQLNPKIDRAGIVMNKIDSAPNLDYDAVVRFFMTNTTNNPLIHALNEHKKFRKAPFVLFSSGVPFMDKDYMSPGNDAYPEQLWSHINNLIRK